MNNVSSRVCIVLAIASAAACTDTESATSLNPAGPPMVRQVRLKEDFIQSGNIHDRRVFAFGTHPNATADDEHAVTTAAALDNSLRIIIDELLIGNNLQEVACRGLVGTDEFSRVPVGATPDDIRRCAAADDVLTSSCPDGATAICICQNDAGCLRGTETVAKGQPVGVLDENLDGGADMMRFIAGAAGIQCGAINVNIDLQSSYWNPSGNQQEPAMGGFDALGPAIVLVSQGPLPTNVTCKLTFAPDVTDKDGIQVCAPPGGDVAQDCTPGNMDAFTFGVEAMSIVPVSWADGDVGVSRTADAFFSLNTNITASTLAGIKVTEGAATNFTAFTVMQPTAVSMKFVWTAPGLKANTKYTITLPKTITDTYNQPLPADAVYTFTTGN